MADMHCDNDAMRDLLPLLAHDALDGAEAAALRAHLATCAPCRAELEVLAVARAAFEQAAPQVDTARILAGVQRQTRLRLEKPVAAAPARRTAVRWMPTRFAAAAASIVLVASASLAVFTNTFRRAGDVVPDSVQVATIDSGRAVATADLSVTGGLSDLSDEDLTTLLAELERVEPTVDAEPASMRRAIVDVPETF